ncbi:MAG: tRNA (N(6)-L-threonylcarbamoyladenosine(37)-C(2))-methylthiotransferase [Desulfurococcales archaeon]|nr:tRNA (N(6)-L-threonylcarbamoyladenosine(37)-C(2))-methylthiotransferase [Desulfurococcales archaeon]
MKKTYYIETYGCALAQYESLMMEEILRNRGFHNLNDPSSAEVIIVNTCAVRLDTEQRIVERLEQLQRINPRAKLVVAGCLASARPGLIKRVAKKASLLSPQNASRILEAVESRNPVIHITRERDTRVHAYMPVKGRIATIMIQEGCRNKCSYCITKLARGAPKSYPPRLIIEQVKRTVEKGALEIRLTGTDTGAYGVDLPGKINVADLVNMILDKVPGEYYIRIGMMTPEEAIRIIDDLIEAYRDDRVFKFFHIPVQSGSNKVLRIMGRRYTREEYEDLHKSIKKHYPDSLFATDIIVGHPGETNEDFQETVELVRKLRFERVHLAQYSIRPHTKAASMRQISDRVKKERSIVLTKLIEAIGKEIYGNYVGKIVDVVIVSKSFRGDKYTARMHNYFPVVVDYSNGEPPRKPVKVKIIDNSFFDLRGKIL